MLRFVFQFTHPGKGATARTERFRRAYVVSIHAPWEGCDAQGVGSQIVVTPFQFTHPGKGATLVNAEELLSHTFQFTHPGKGATESKSSSVIVICRFNSRTLGRVRLPPTDTRAGEEGFNSRTLGRVRQVRQTRLIPIALVSIHAPWEGCDG